MFKNYNTNRYNILFLDDYYEKIIKSDVYNLLESCLIENDYDIKINTVNTIIVLLKNGILILLLDKFTLSETLLDSIKTYIDPGSKPALLLQVTEIVKNVIISSIIFFICRKIC